jgi:choline dehydrogenase-like flavoprotein
VLSGALHACGPAVKRAIVIGSGAGGAVAARELQGAFDVTVLEAGGEFRPFGRDLARLERLRATRLFRDERQIRLLFPAMRVARAAEHMSIVTGVATGGTTTLTTGNALRCDEGLRELGIDLDAEFAELQAELRISTAHRRRWRPVTGELFAACQDLGLKPQATPKMVDFERCEHCGRCVLGCPTGAKWDSRAPLSQAVAAGARLVTHARVEALAVEHEAHGRSRVLGVHVRRHGRKARLLADLVVLAAGGLGTPAILERSGIRTESRLFVDPVLCVAAPLPGSRLDREFPMPFYVERGGYLVSPYFDFLSFFFDRHWRHTGGDIVSLMIKLADTELGAVDGRRVRKELTSRDRARLREATGLCIEVLARLGVPRGDVFFGSLNAGHPGGTLPLTGGEREALRDDRLPDGLYVADASLLPRSLGKPPSLTIMALALRVARAAKARA